MLTLKIGLVNAILCYIVYAAAAFVLRFERNKKNISFIRRHSSVAEGETASRVAVERVNVCMGELCRCQEGENSEIILADLNARNFPFAVEDAPCLGACGMGAMVSVEYEDGDYLLVTGLQETLEAIASTNQIVQQIYYCEERNDIYDSLTNLVDTEKYSNYKDSSMKSTDQYAICKDIKNASVTDQTIKTMMSNNYEDKNLNSDCSIEEDHNAIKRMRAEALQNEKKSNPWINMAMYIGQKMKDNIIKTND